MAHYETELAKVIRVEHARRGGFLDRNNSGVGVRDDGVPVRFGLGNDSKEINKIRKSSDLIGVTPIKITQYMVGKTIGVYTAIEMKNEDFIYRPTDKRAVAQANFLNQVINHNGIGMFVTSLEDYENTIEWVIK